MEDRILLSVKETESGLEIKIDEEAYGNLALVGVLEKLKLTLINEKAPNIKPSERSSYLEYDA
jgi:hypothetical protein